MESTETFDRHHYSNAERIAAKEQPGYGQAFKDADHQAPAQEFGRRIWFVCWGRGGSAFVRSIRGSSLVPWFTRGARPASCPVLQLHPVGDFGPAKREFDQRADRKSTRLNSSHVAISYAVFCLKKKSREKGGK